MKIRGQAVDSSSHNLSSLFATLANIIIRHLSTFTFKIDQSIFIRRANPLFHRAIMTTLQTSLEALPPELYNMIFDFTFTPSFMDRTEPYKIDAKRFTLDFTPTLNDRIIDASYKPPQLLQISRATRKKYAKAYYGNGSVFFINGDLDKRFINTIPRKHARQIRDVRIMEDWHVFFGYSRDRNNYYQFVLANHCNKLKSVRAKDIKIKIVCHDGSIKWGNKYDFPDEAFGQ